MMVQIKTSSLFQLVAGLLFVFSAGCEPNAQPGDIAIKQGPGEYAVRVLLNNKISGATIKIDSPYKIASIDTAEILSAQKTNGTIGVEAGNEGIKIGERLFKTKRLIIELCRDA
jgi:hypothetical protein